MNNNANKWFEILWLTYIFFQKLVNLLYKLTRRYDFYNNFGDFIQPGN